LKVAPYYGCQVVRPYATFDEAWNPITMDRILEALGAEIVHYPLKTKCCGGSFTGTVPEAGLRMSYILLKEAVRRGADVIATICPLCQFNLDGYHDQIEKKRWGQPRIPTVYFTQLMGLAFGIEPRTSACKAFRLHPQPLHALRRAGIQNLGASYEPIIVSRTETATATETAPDGPHRVLRLPLRSQHRGVVDCPAVAEYVGRLPGVVLSRDYKYMCSDPGQELIQQDIREHKLNRIVVASCSPLLHEHTFRTAVERGGLNPFYFQMVNIREHDSWVHTDPPAATEKAKAPRAPPSGACALPQGARKNAVNSPGRAGGRRRHRGHPRRADPGQRRQEGLPGGARAEHRRPHGASSTRPFPRWTAPPASSRPRCPPCAPTRTSRSGPTRKW
jgi:hypothetical protein